MNVDDPTTWPEDPADLLAAMEGKTGNEEVPTAHEAEPEQDAVEPEAVKPTPEPEQEPAVEPGGTGGEKLVPVSALAELRAELRAQKEHAAMLARQVESLSRGPEPAAPDTAPAQDHGPSLDDLIKRATSDGDDDLAAALRMQQAQAARLEALENALGQQQAAHEQAQQSAVMAAFEASPLLKAWAADVERPLWHQTGVQLHHALLADPRSEYARLSPMEQFARLPGLVEAQLGVESPHRAALTPASSAARPRSSDGRFAQKEPPAAQVPLSMSQIPGGIAADPAPRKPEDLEGLPAAEQREALLRMAEAGPDQLYKFLDDAPFGSLNSRSMRPR